MKRLNVLSSCRAVAATVFILVFFMMIKPYIATYNLNIKENKTFIAFSNHFKTKNLPVPEILFINDDITAYVQQDLGTVSLLDMLEQHGHNNHVFQLYKKSLKPISPITDKW